MTQAYNAERREFEEPPSFAIIMGSKGKVGAAKLGVSDGGGWIKTGCV